MSLDGPRSPPANDPSDGHLRSLVILGTILRNGTYTVAVSGIAAHLVRTEIANPFSILIFPINVAKATWTSP